MWNKPVIYLFFFLLLFIPSAVPAIMFTFHVSRGKKVTKGGKVEEQIPRD